MLGPWVNELNNELNQMHPSAESITKWDTRCIYRLPAYVTGLKREAFEPRTVSIGPYHYGRENLKAMEQHKHRALLSFLGRTKKPLKSYVNALTPFVQNLKDAYDELNLEWQRDTEAFLKLMILDGCFILEMLLATTRSSQVDSPKDHRARNDHPIFSDHGRSGLLYLVSYLKRDMLMLENQIPILVLQILFRVAFMPVNGDEESDVVLEIESESDKSVKEKVAMLILSFFSQPSVSNFSIVPEPFWKCLHILDMYRTRLIFENPRRRKIINWFPRVRIHHPRLRIHHREDIQDIIRSATELKEAGIKFKISKSRSLRDISFHHGTLKLPLIVVDDALESLYVNMIAFERLHVGAGNEVTSYIFFMDTLLNIPTDVSILESRGIIQNKLGNENAAANLFNSLSTGIILDPNSHLYMVRKQISVYCQKRRRKWKAYYRHKYYNFTNPRDALSFQIGIYLFCFTIIQTIFTVLSYKSSSPSK